MSRAEKENLRKVSLACLLVFVVALGVYLLTLAPTVTLVVGDWATAEGSIALRG